MSGRRPSFTPLQLERALGEKESGDVCLFVCLFAVKVTAADIIQRYKKKYKLS